MNTVTLVPAIGTRMIEAHMFDSHVLNGSSADTIADFDCVELLVGIRGRGCIYREVSDCYVVCARVDPNYPHGRVLLVTDDLEHGPRSGTLELNIRAVY